jgi:hypothetical protein
MIATQEPQVTRVMLGNPSPPPPTPPTPLMQGVGEGFFLFNYLSVEHLSFPPLVYTEGCGVGEWGSIREPHIYRG